MATRIDYDRSIRRGRLCWKRDWEGKFSILHNYFWWAFTMLLLVVAPIQLSIKEIKAGTFGEISTAFCLGAFSIGLIALYGIFNIFKLRRIAGIDAETNRKIITRILKVDFEKINEDASGTKILTIRKPGGFLNLAERATVLFDDKDILINIITIGRNDVFSIFHSISNDDRVRRIINEFKEELKKTPIKVLE